MAGAARHRLQVGATATVQQVCRRWERDVDVDLAQRGQGLASDLLPSGLGRDEPEVPPSERPERVDPRRTLVAHAHRDEVPRQPILEDAARLIIEVAVVARNGAGVAVEDQQGLRNPGAVGEFVR